MFHVLPGKAVAAGHNWFLWKIGILSLFHLCWSSERVALVTEPSPPGRQVQSPISWSSRAALHQTPSQWNLMLLISAACLHVVINESLQLIISNATLQPGLQGWEESVSFLFVFSVCVPSHSRQLLLWMLSNIIQQFEKGGEQSFFHRLCPPLPPGQAAGKALE